MDILRCYTDVNYCKHLLHFIGQYMIIKEGIQMVTDMEISPYHKEIPIISFIDYDDPISDNLQNKLHELFASESYTYDDFVKIIEHPNSWYAIYIDCEYTALGNKYTGGFKITRIEKNDNIHNNRNQYDIEFHIDSKSIQIYICTPFMIDHNDYVRFVNSVASDAVDKFNIECLIDMEILDNEMSKFVLQNY